MSQVLSVPYYYGLREKLSEPKIANGLVSVIRKGGDIDSMLSRDEILQAGVSTAHNDRIDLSQESRIVQLSETQRNEVFNIIGDDLVTKRVITDLQVGSINVSGNPLNFTVEQELKLLKIKFKKLSNRLAEIGFKNKFSGLIWDVYNEFTTGKKLEQNKDFKSVHRVRFKVPDKSELSTLLTLKRKDKQNLDQNVGSILTRTCYEIEYLIQEFRETTYGIDKLGLQPFREKVKYRESFVKEFDEGYLVVADIDFYSGIPVLVELEISKTQENGVVINPKEDEKFISWLISELGLSKNEIFDKGSRKLFELYNVLYRDF